MLARQWFFLIASITLVGIALLSLLWQNVLWSFVVVGPLVVLGLLDATHSRHNVLRNYPVVGHLRYFAEFIRPNIQQYFINTNQSGRPYPREIRDLVDARARGGEALLPFGTQHDVLSTGDEFSYHSLHVKHVPEEDGRVLVGGPDCTQPYLASRLNISAMSFGALSSNAVIALNTGAKMAHCFHYTGEGGLADYHLQGGGDVSWQIGTDYFGARTEDGKFDQELFKKKSRLDNVKMIAIKLSQGAKPSHGGVLPSAKITPEISKIRGVPMGKDCLSPPTHSAFSTPRGLLECVKLLRELSDGKPIGFKLCIGNKSEFLGIVKAMVDTGIKPDFIQVDGSEGGTGAAPLEFTNRLGMPINEAIAFVHDALVGAGVRDDIRLIASGKVATGYDMVTKIALGADMCSAARAFMFTVGCIQALHCHTNKCPTGIATQNPVLARAVVVADKAPRVAKYHDETVRVFRELVGAMGLERIGDLGRGHILRRMDDTSAARYDEIYPPLNSGDLSGDTAPDRLARDWALADADRF